MKSDEERHRRGSSNVAKSKHVSTEPPGNVDRNMDKVDEDSIKVRAII